jgi:hypothetical protein
MLTGVSLVCTLETHTDAVNGAVFIPVGGGSRSGGAATLKVASASADGTAVVWNLERASGGGGGSRSGGGAGGGGWGGEISHVLCGGGGRVWAVAASDDG